MVSEATVLTADERLSLIWVKIERAKKHILDLKGEIEAFLSTKPYGIVEKIDPKLGKLSYGISRVTPIPGIISAITGDAIQNLRSALDHLAYQLRLVHLGTNVSDERVKFPIANTAKEYETTIDRKVQFRTDAFDALRNVEAYKGGKGHEIWVLNRLNSIDKHRSIIAVGSAYDTVNLLRPPVIELGRSGFTGPSSKASEFPHMVFFRPAVNMCPLKIGDALLVRSEMHLKQDFRFDIAINEPKIMARPRNLWVIFRVSDVLSRRPAGIGRSVDRWSRRSVALPQGFGGR